MQQNNNTAKIIVFFVIVLTFVLGFIILKRNSKIEKRQNAPFVTGKVNQAGKSSMSTQSVSSNMSLPRETINISYIDMHLQNLEKDLQEIDTSINDTPIDVMIE